MSATCGSCGAPVVWVRTPSGARMPLDPMPLPDRDLAPSLVAKHHDECRVIATVDLDAAREWLRAGWTLHRSHFSTCPNASQHRRRRRQGQTTIEGTS